jgi:hypothetical protein
MLLDVEIATPLALEKQYCILLLPLRFFILIDHLNYLECQKSFLLFYGKSNFNASQTFSHPSRQAIKSFSSL